MPGLRVHITGSAAADSNEDLLARAHAFVRELTAQLIDSGSGLVLGAGAEPRGDAALPCIFDWTALQTVAEFPDPAPAWPGLRAQRFVIIASQRGLDRIPEQRKAIWETCRNRSDVQLVVAPRGWRMAGIIRERQVQHGDILIVLGGGAGAEHLAELYRDEGKPVIPIWAELGAYNEDGSGGSRALHEQALDTPTKYFALRPSVGSEAARLTSLRLTSDTDPASLAGAVTTLIGDLKPPAAFFVRLLDPDDPVYPPVERFFRDVVDHVVTERGYTPLEMGRGKPEVAFMNVEIFKALHRASLVIVDLTGMRSNCTMELGYALARRRRVVISAEAGTKLIFDAANLPTYFWEDTVPVDERRTAYRNWLDQYSELPPVVE
jgi:ATP nucleosidase Cap17-like, N-terminal